MDKKERSKRLIRLFAKKDLEEIDRREINDMMGPDFDAEFFIHFFNKFFSASLLVHHLAGMQKIPIALEPYYSTLLTYSKNDRITCEVRYMQLKKLMSTLQENGIKAVIMKGFCYNYYIYSDIPYFRKAGDFDILVDTPDLVLCHRILQKNGFITTVSEDRLVEIIGEPHHHLRPYTNTKQNNTIEIHKLTYYPGYLNLREIYNNAVNIDGLFLVSQEDLCLISAHHLYSHLPCNIRNLKYNFPRMIMDFVEAYHSIQDTGTIANRIQAIGNQLIFDEMIQMTNRYYQGEKFSTKEQFRINSASYDLFDLFFAMPPVSDDNHVITQDIEHGISSRYYEISDYDVKKVGMVPIWPTPYYVKFGEIKDHIGIQYNIKLQKGSIRLDIWSQDLGHISNVKDGFNDIFTYFILKIAGEYDAQPQILYIQPNKVSLKSIFYFSEGADTDCKPFIESKSNGKLSEGGGQYHYIATIDFENIRDRDVIQMQGRLYFDLLCFYHEAGAYYNSVLIGDYNGYRDVVFSRPRVGYKRAIMEQN